MTQIEMTHIEKQCVETLTRVLRLRKLKPKSLELRYRLYWIDVHYRAMLKEMFRLDQLIKKIQDIDYEIKKFKL